MITIDLILLSEFIVSGLVLNFKRPKLAAKERNSSIEKEADFNKDCFCN